MKQSNLNNSHWHQTKKSLVDSDGTHLCNNPMTGLLWNSEKEAIAYIAKEVAQQSAREKANINKMVQEKLAKPYLSLDVAAVKVLPDSGMIISISELEASAKVQSNMHLAEYQPNQQEITASKGSCLHLTGALLQRAKKNSAKAELITAWPKALLTVPLVNQVTGEQDLLAATVDQGKVSLTVPLDKAGYWEINAELLNNKLSKELALEMQTLVFVVINTPLAQAEELSKAASRSAAEVKPKAKVVSKAKPKVVAKSKVSAKTTVRKTVIKAKVASKTTAKVSTGKTARKTKDSTKSKTK